MVIASPSHESSDRRRALGLVALIIGLIVVAYWSVGVHGGAVSSCVDLDAGGRAYFFFLVWPAFATTLLAAGLLPLALRIAPLRWRLALSAALVTIAVLWFLAGTPGYIRDLSAGIGCPDGLPAGWPTWLNR